MLVALTIVGLLAGWLATTVRLQRAESELAILRRQSGFLQPSGVGQIAAVRLDSDQPLMYRFKVRVAQSPAYRIAYSTHWKSGRPSPQWYSAIDLPPGESQVIIQIQQDPRDDRWKITLTVRSDRGTKRMATVLPMDHVSVFRQSNDVVSTGVGRRTAFTERTQAMRLLDERWLVGEGGLLLYGNRQPDDDILGVFAELQPDSGPL